MRAPSHVSRQFWTANYSVMKLIDTSTDLISNQPRNTVARSWIYITMNGIRRPKFSVEDAWHMPFGPVPLKQSSMEESPTTDPTVSEIFTCSICGKRVGSSKSFISWKFSQLVTGNSCSNPATQKNHKSVTYPTAEGRRLAGGQEKGHASLAPQPKRIATWPSQIAPDAS